MIYPLVLELAATGAPLRVPVAVTCRILGIARQPFYRWLANPVTSVEWNEALIANAVFDAHHDDPEFGYRFIADEVRDGGISVSDRTVWKVCSERGWWSAFGKKKGTKGKKPGPPVHDDRVQRDFTADAPNQLWLTDIERHEAFLDLAVVKGHRWMPVAAGI